MMKKVIFVMGRQSVMIQKEKMHKKEEKGGIFEFIFVLIQALFLAALIRTLFFSLSVFLQVQCVLLCL